MYCPKCNQKFEVGSRRFCPTDGARLIDDQTAAIKQPQGGIFANLIPKMHGIDDLGTSPSAGPGAFPAKSSGPGSLPPEEGSEGDDLFFEIDDPAPSEAETKLIKEPTLKADLPKERLPGYDSPVVPSARKIDLDSVPEGRIDLESGYRSPDILSSFDTENPDILVGGVVKGRYKVREFLGGDESGFAYLADDRIVDGKTVLVRVHISSSGDEMIKSILSEERIALSHFSHPNIARVIDSGEFVNGTSFIISEYVDGLTVADILSIHGTFDTTRAERIIRQVSMALNEAHQEGILHRDIRPENIVIDPDIGDIEQAKLVNFGASSGEPNQDNLVYKSPEVVDGRINTIVTDIFSLAVVAFEMLTGGLPFEGESKAEILRSQYAGPAAFPSAINRQLPPAVDQVFLRALAFRPADRYKKARELGEALTAALTAPSISEEKRIDQPNILDLKPLVPAPENKERGTPVSPRIQMPRVKRPESKPAETADPKKAAVPAVRDHRLKPWHIAAALFLLLAAGSVIGWYYLSGNPGGPTPGDEGAQNRAAIVNSSSLPQVNEPNGTERPLARNLAQPPNTKSFQNTKQNLKGDLASNFLGFSLFYPDGWQVIGPQPGTSSSARGKFLDISRTTIDGRLQEQMLVSYYPSGGTFDTDSQRFPQLVKETSETLEKILPGYQVISQGEVPLNGGWRAYEVKFQGGGTSAAGEKLEVWGRRLWVPAAQEGVQSGYEITMLATSNSENVKGVDDVGVRGELGPILYSFEPSQNF